jgi:succinylglutamic semialdehyde dehydrogenase
VTAGFLESRCPADPSLVLGRFPIAEAAEIDRAVERARRAFPGWRDLGLEARASHLVRFRDLVRSRSDDLARRIALEVGKAIWDAKSEAVLVAAKVDVTLDEGLRFVATLEAGPGARATYHPRGVLAVLGPFNFPAHLPNGHIVPALATGNTVIWKPSELAPAVAEWIASAWHEAGLPDGVLGVVQGSATTGRTLAVHPDVDGVLFTGSSATGAALSRATLDQPGKLLALELGGKNGILVLDDADLDLALAETAISICATTGQRCSSASRIFVAEKVFDSFAERLARILRGVAIGPPLDPGVFMGPLVSEAAYEKLLRYRALSIEAGGERIVESDTRLEPPFAAPGLARFADASQRHPYHRDEIFGPEAGIHPVPDLDAGIAALDDCDFGLVASIFTRDRSRYEHGIGRVRTGLLHWNRGTIGASGRLPFGGLRRSGNDRPAGILSTVYCSVVQAHLEHEGGFDPASLPPGMPRP